jgi:DNA-binding HxlR family transcriptional regulator
MSKIKRHHEIDSIVRLIADWRSMAVVHAVYERGELRYTDLADMLQFSPTVLSKKLSQLSDAAIIVRSKKQGAKEVVYTVEPIARKIVQAYHLLEGVDSLLATKNKEGVS